MKYIELERRNATYYYELKTKEYIYIEYYIYIKEENGLQYHIERGRKV